MSLNTMRESIKKFIRAFDGVTDKFELFLSSKLEKDFWLFSLWSWWNVVIFYTRTKGDIDLKFGIFILIPFDYGLKNSQLSTMLMNDGIKSFLSF